MEIIKTLYMKALNAARVLRWLRPDPTSYRVTARIFDAAIRGPRIVEGWLFTPAGDAEIKSQLSPLNRQAL